MTCPLHRIAAPIVSRGHCCVLCCENYKIVFPLDRWRCSFFFSLCFQRTKPFTCRLQVRARKNARVSRVIYPSRPSPSTLPAPIPPPTFHPSSSSHHSFTAPPGLLLRLSVLLPPRLPASSLGSRKMGNRHPESFLFHRNECPGLPGATEGQGRRKMERKGKRGREDTKRGQTNVSKKQLLVVCVAIFRCETEIRPKDSQT